MFLGGYANDAGNSAWRQLNVQEAINMFIFKLPLCTAVLCFFITSCGQVNYKQVLTECKELAATNNPESWKEVQEKLEPLVLKKKMMDDVIDADRLYCFYMISLMKTNKIDQANDFAEIGLERYPESPMLNFLVGKLYMEEGRLVEAVPFLEKANDLKPGDTNTLALLLHCAAETKNPRADMYFQQAVMMDEFRFDPAFHNQWGRLLVSQKKYFGSIQKFSAAYRVDKSDPTPFIQMAIVFEKHLQNDKVARSRYVKYLIEISKNPSSGSKENMTLVKSRLRAIQQRAAVAKR